MKDTTDGIDPSVDEPAPGLDAAPPEVVKYNTKAVIGLILSIVSVLLILVPVVNLVLAVPGIILGVLGGTEIASSGERSREVARAAVVIGALSAAVSLLIVIGAAIAAGQLAGQLQPGGGGDSDACTSTTGHFTQKQLQACFDSQNG